MNSSGTGSIPSITRREHGSLQTTPLLRWQQDIAQVRQLPPATDMRRLFFHRLDSTAWCAAIPRSCCAIVSSKRRLILPAGKSRCVSIRSI